VEDRARAPRPLLNIKMNILPFKPRVEMVILTLIKLTVCVYITQRVYTQRRYLSI
jgi:hypothetical protein